MYALLRTLNIDLLARRFHLPIDRHCLEARNHPDYCMGYDHDKDEFTVMCLPTQMQIVFFEHQGHCIYVPCLCCNATQDPTHQ